MRLSVARDMSNNQLLRAVRNTAPQSDPDEFWVTDRVQPGRGYSCMTYAHTTRPNGVPVYLSHYTPGPFDLVAYGPDSSLSSPRSTYSVYCEVLGLEDSASKKSCLQAIKDKHANVNARALAKGIVDIWSPDGEGALYLEFKEEHIEVAFALADSLNDRQVETSTH